MCRYQLKHAPALCTPQLTHTFSLHTLTAPPLLQSQAFFCLLLVHAHIHTLTSLNQRIFLFFSWYPDSPPVLVEVFFLPFLFYQWSIFHLSLTLDSSQQVGHLTQVKQNTTSYKMCANVPHVWTLFSITCTCEVAVVKPRTSESSDSKLDKSFGKSLQI